MYVHAQSPTRHLHTHSPSHAPTQAHTLAEWGEEICKVFFCTLKVCKDNRYGLCWLQTFPLWQSLQHLASLQENWRHYAWNTRGLRKFTSERLISRHSVHMLSLSLLYPTEHEAKHCCCEGSAFWFLQISSALFCCVSYCQFLCLNFCKIFSSEIFKVW